MRKKWLPVVPPVDRMTVGHPKNWKSEIVPRIRARSGNRCECTGQCGVNHVGEEGLNLDEGKVEPNQSTRCPRWHLELLVRDDRDDATVILTVMHLNHQPEDCSDDNLLHACQGCHNRYDAPMRAAGIKARRKAERASGDLFQCEEVS